MTSNSSIILSQLLNKTVRVRTTCNNDYIGTLLSLDGYMNVAMEKCQQIPLVMSGNSNAIRSFGDVFIRGNNVLYISAINE